MKNDVLALQKTTDSLRSVLNSTNQNLAQTNSNLSSVQKSIDSLKIQLTSISGQISSLITELNTANANITSITNQLTLLNQQYAELLAKLNSLTLLVFNPSTLNNGLVAFYPFTGNAIDSSGNGNNGLVVGAILSTDRLGNTNSCYSFDGNGDYINCGNATSINLTGSISIHAWIFANNFNTDHGIISKMITSSTSPFGIITNSPFSVAPLNRIRWDIGNNFIFTNPISSNQWINVITTYDVNTKVKNIYLNGVLSASGISSATSIPTNTDNLYIGAHQPTNISTWSWDGKIDEVRIYNRVLTNTEIDYLSKH